MVQVPITHAISSFPILSRPGIHNTNCSLHIWALSVRCFHLLYGRYMGPLNMLMPNASKTSRHPVSSSSLIRWLNRWSFGEYSPVLQIPSKVAFKSRLNSFLWLHSSPNRVSHVISPLLHPVTDLARLEYMVYHLIIGCRSAKLFAQPKKPGIKEILMSRVQYYFPCSIPLKPVLVNSMLKAHCISHLYNPPSVRCPCHSF